MNKIVKILIGIVAIGIIGFVIFKSHKASAPAAATSTGTTTTSQVPAEAPNVYVNKEYGFAFTLPESWDGYTIIEDDWQGDSIDANGQVKTDTVEGPMVSIRHPDWDYKAPRQDIPIMVFTIAQWNDMQADKFHIGAAPINPSELARNKKYVFAIPARYNFSYLVGYEEVDKIIQSKPIKTF